MLLLSGDQKAKNSTSWYCPESSLTVVGFVASSFVRTTKVAVAVGVGVGEPDGAPGMVAVGNTAVGIIVAGAVGKPPGVAVTALVGMAVEVPAGGEAPGAG
jgi:hypothetical protein